MASKSKRRGRVFRASCILAALIIAGSSFAWFASKDEVTNRLTATADYGVSLVEDFSPPKAMTPGENVNKDVSVVNTGSIDAFTRVALENQLEITTYDSEDFTFSTFGDVTKTYYRNKRTTVSIGDTSYLNDTAANNAITALGTAPTGTTYEAQGISGLYYIKTTVEETLPKLYETSAERDAERTALVTSTPDIGTSGQPGSVTYSYTNGDDVTVNLPKNVTVTAPVTTDGVKLSTDESVNVNTGKLTPNEVTTLQAGGKLVMAASKVVAAKDQIVVAGDDTTPPTQSDYDGSGQYTPAGAGLYIFERTVYEGTGNNETEYSGYYYDGTDFYALKTKVKETNDTDSIATPYIDFGDNSGTPYTGFTYDADGQINGIDGTVSLLTKKTYDTAGFADPTAGAGTAAVTTSFGLLTPGANGTADTFLAETSDLNDKAKVNAVKLTITTDGNANDTVIYIKLDDNWADYWEIVEPSTATSDIADWFYYKDTVKSGETTEKLVDYVRIDNKTNQTDYVDIIYDLNVVLESEQITHNDEGDETATAVPSTWATPTLTTTPVNNNGNVSVITAIDWN